MATRNFPDFWSEIGKSFLIGALKATIYFLIILPLLVIFFRWIQCNGWWGYTDPVKTHACVDMAHPFLYWTRILGEFPRVFLPGFIIVLLAILYLEWDKYKKDLPSGFGMYLGWTVPSGGWMRANFERLVSTQAWAKFQEIEAVYISESEAHLRGAFSDQRITDMTKGISKRITSFLRDSQIDEADCMEWLIHANSGEELKLRLEREEGDASWQLTASLFEWNGRKQPARLIKTHVTRFLNTAR